MSTDWLDMKKAAASVEPPKATKKPFKHIKHDHTRIDDYYWLRDRENQEVIDYLEAENEYFEKVTAHNNDFGEKIFEELKGRIKEEDESVPYKLDDYYYYTRYVVGGEYPIFCRKKGSMENEEEVLADGNKMAEGNDYFSLKTSISSNHDKLALITDTVGRRIYQIRFKDVESGEFYPETIENATGNMVWTNDDQYVFYSKMDEETLRSHLIYRHRLGTDPAEDVIVYDEKDDTFYTWVQKTKSKKFIMIGSGATLSDEYRYIPADDALADFKIIQPRERELEYSIDHFGEYFYIRTNLDATNFKLVKTPVADTTKEHWEDVVPHREDVLFEGCELFNDFLVIEEKSEGLTRIKIATWEGESHFLDFGEPAYTAYIGYNPDYKTNLLRFGYSSMTTPNSVYDYHMVSRQKELKKQQEVLGDFDPAKYVSERVWVTARDGAQIPMSIVYKKGFKKDGSQPLLQYAYGSYGHTIDAYFSSARLSLLDRGFAFAIAHIRGGQMMGRQWYDDGKMLKKWNTFNDYIDCSKHLINEKYTSPDKLFATGGSAGGLLMGVIANTNPELYKGIVAQVPFVDVITTMLDESIPLTTGEYDEWGNPNEKVYYDYILTYSPYDNIKEQSYPNMLITTGLHDSQVQYWEPAKWVALLRDKKQDNNVLLLHINMDAGHGGASGRFNALKEVAREYVFMFDLLGIKE